MEVPTTCSFGVRLASVLRCRAAVVVLLGLKRRRGDVLRLLDPSVVQDVARAAWATRADCMWQLDWASEELRHAARSGQLLAYLDTLPRQCWRERNPSDGTTLLHHAARGDNVDAVVALVHHGLNVNASTHLGWRPLHYAACAQSRVVRALCAAGADVRATTCNLDAPLDLALSFPAASAECVTVLLANGARLSNARDTVRQRITPAMREVESAVRRCRSAVVALRALLAARAGFAADAVVRAVWATRTDFRWAPPAMESEAAVTRASKQGRLYALLLTLPREQWRLGSDKTFLHYACMGNNVDAVVALLRHGLDVNAVATNGWTPAIFAAYYGQSRTLEVLVAAGANLSYAVSSKDTAFVWVGIRWMYEGRGLDCVRVMLANCHHPYPLSMTPWMQDLERGVRRCRAAVVVLLGLKRRRGDVMWALDRWVVRELCFALWATRTNVQWSL